MNLSELIKECGDDLVFLANKTAIDKSHSYDDAIRKNWQGEWMAITSLKLSKNGFTDVYGSTPEEACENLIKRRNELETNILLA